MYEYALWERIIEEVGDVDYADRVFSAFALESDMEELKVELESVSARELDDLRIVRSERRKFEEYLTWERAEEAKRNAPKTTG